MFLALALLLVLLMFLYHVVLSSVKVSGPVAAVVGFSLVFGAGVCGWSFFIISIPSRPGCEKSAQGEKKKKNF